MLKKARHRFSDEKTPRISGKTDRSFIMVIGFLLLFGVVMIHNATVVYSQGLFGGAYRFVFLQLVWVAIGLVGFLFFYKSDYREISKVAYPLFLLTFIPLCILGLLGALTKIGLMSCSSAIPFTPCLNGAYRWLYINPPPFPRLPLFGVLGFQPSELAKLSLILYLSVQLNKIRSEKNVHFTVFMVSAGLISFLVLMQPNMSTAALIFLIAVAVYFASGAPIVPLLVSLPVLGSLGMIFMLTSAYRRERLLTLIQPSSGGDLSMGYHIKQILIALGSGGIFGIGFGQSRQKFQYLPEVSSDSIFAIIGEEMGFIGTTLIILVFCYLIYRGISIAKRSPDLLGRLLAVGVTSWIALQFFVNIAAMTKLIPLTGVPIPLISYGGSSMVFSLMGLGVLAAVDRISQNN